MSVTPNVGEHVSDEETIFSISEGHLDSGLRGIPVGTCRTSYVDTIDGVHYVGQLANKGPHLFCNSKRNIMSRQHSPGSCESVGR